MRRYFCASYYRPETARAKAQVTSEEQVLAEFLAGSREEEIAAAQARVNEAEADLKDVRQNYQMTRELAETQYATEQKLNSAGAAPLVFESVTKAFAAGKRKTQALERADFRIAPGRVTGLVGPDGAGKTTLLRLAAGLMVPDEGRVQVLGHDGVQEPLEIQATIGYMPQRFGLYEDLTVRENLDLYADLRGLAPAGRHARYEELMNMTRLGRFTRRMTAALSGGMKQKLGLACALVRSPELLLLDEPTVGVDPISRRELREIVYRLVEEGDLTVMLPLRTWTRSKGATGCSSCTRRRSWDKAPRMISAEKWRDGSTR